MMSGAMALLVATLVGVFITPDGIVIGTDTALSNLGGQVASQQKHCITGPRSVATMQGAGLSGRHSHEDDRRVANGFAICAARLAAHHRR